MHQTSSTFMLIKCIIFIIVYINSVSCNDVNNSPYVITNDAKFKGSTLHSTHGKLIHSFRGIRYGKPPIGKLRFMPPQPIDQNGEEFDASEEGPACPQPGDLNVSEDCLRLNVYTTNFHSDSKEKFPVIFYMHPGGFYGVSGQSLFSGPEYLLDHDVVLVSINYRLGSLGFISTGDSNAPGNNGFKDQVLALKWVRENIAAFGGDPNNVTIMGYSAGSLSVTLHLISSMSKGLFHRAIAMSASTTADWVVTGDQLHLAKKQAELLDCPTDNSTIIIECLRTKDAKEMGDSLFGFFEFGYNPFLLWQPVIEPDCGQERFLTDDPVKLIQQGHLYHVPFMTGITKYEFAGPAYAVIGNSTMMEVMNREWDTIAPIAFFYERNTTNSKKISKTFKTFQDFYLQSSDIQNDERSIKGLRNLFADGVIGFPVHRFVNLMANYSKKPVFYYKFSYTGRFSHFYLPSNTSEKNVLGPVHHDDLLYLFNLDKIFPKFNVTDNEYRIVNLMTKMWTNFAKYGSPTPQTSEKDLFWPQYNNDTKLFLEIGDNSTSVDSCLYCDRYSVWDNLFPIM